MGRIIKILVAAAIVCGCSPRIIESVKVEKVTEYRDSISFRDTTFYVPIPLGKDQAIVDIRDTSRLETSVAESIAYVDSTGRLHHRLENKKATIPFTAKIESKTIWVNTTTKSTQYSTKIVEVDKPLTWWQKFRIRAFWGLLLAVVALILFASRKVWLKFV